MDLSFADAGLAALCNSESRMSERWGSDVGRLVARRLLELAAADADVLDRLPRAEMSAAKTSGETIIDFDGGDMVFRGEIRDGPGTRASRSRLLITGLDVRGSARS